MEMLADLNRNMQSGHIRSELYRSTDEFLPETYRLDIVADFVNFLKTDNDSFWLAKSSTSNMGRGIEMIRDAAAYKESLMTVKDKWGESAFQPEEAKEVFANARDMTAEDVAEVNQVNESTTANTA